MKLIYTLLVTMLLTLSLQAQSIKTFQGPYAHGNAVYNYYELPKEGRVYHGAFQATYNYNPDTGEGFWVDGTYAHNLKEGKWIYHVNSYKAENVQEFAANFVRGELFGECTYTEERNGVMTDRYDVTMKGNRVVRVQINHTDSDGVKHRKTGECDASGFPEGIWREEGIKKDGFLYTCMEEWNSGRLVKRTMKNDSTGEVEEIKNPDPEEGIPVQALARYNFRNLLFPLLDYSYGAEKIEQFCAILEKGEIPFEGIPIVKDNGAKGKPGVSTGRKYLFYREREEKSRDDDIYEYPEVLPEFPGGEKAMLKWLGSNVKYPALAAENNIQGRVMVSFVVERDGSVSNVKVDRGVDPSLDKEAVRLVQSMPKWKPGMYNGKPVRCRFRLPVTFKLH